VPWCPPHRRFAPLTLPFPFSSTSLRGSPGGPLLSPSSSRASFSTSDPWRPPRCRVVPPTSPLVPSPPPTRHQPYINPSRLLNPPPIPWPRYRWSLSVMAGECIGWVWPTPNRRGTCGTRAASSPGPLLVAMAAYFYARTPAPAPWRLASASSFEFEELLKLNKCGGRPWRIEGHRGRLYES
jgi:hypothetical protein